MSTQAQSIHPSDAPGPLDEGTRRIIDQVERVYYSGYWVKTYPVPTDELRAKSELIEALTRRLFNHTEHGLNVPGSRLKEARAAYDAEADPARRRVMHHTAPGLAIHDFRRRDARQLCWRGLSQRGLGMARQYRGLPQPAFLCAGQ